MDWVSVIQGLSWGVLVGVGIVQAIRLHRIQQQLDHVDVISEMAFTALEAHLKGQHVELHQINLAEDGTPIRETDQE